MATTPDRSYVCPIIVGRAGQLLALDAALQRAGQGGVNAVLLSGEAGIGKSRLASEATIRAAAEGFLIVRGDCFEGGRALPYSALLEMLRSYLSGLTPEPIVATLGPEAGEIVKLLPELATLAGVEIMPAPPLDAEQEKRRLFHALLNVLRRLAGQQPLLAVIEDLHWSDETTLEFLQFVCRSPQSGVPLLLVMSYRSDEVQPALAHFLAELDRTRRAVELPLNRLTAVETDVMMRAILDIRQPVRRDVLEAFHSVTNGNPFFIEEILKASSVRLDSGTPAANAGSDRIDLQQVPRTVQDALRQRVARLSESAGHLLDVAAVAGMRLDLPLLQEVTRQDDAALLASIKELIAAQLIIEEGATFSFRHALTRQAIYVQLLGIERRRIHLQIGDALERIYGASPDQVEIHAGDLAHHFYEAEAWAKALPYCERAGAQAGELSTPAAVIRHLERAGEAAHRLSLDPSPKRLRLLANAHDVVGEFERAQATMQAALEAARRQSDRQEQWHALIGLGIVWSARDYAVTGEHWRAALDLARSTSDQTLLAHSLNRAGNWYLNVEQPVEAVRHHDEALRIFEQLGDAGGNGETVDLLGMAWFLGGDMARSRAYYERALALFEQQHDSQGYSSSLSTMSVCAPVYHTDTLPPSVTLAQGAEWLEQARMMAAGIGWRAGECYALFDLGLVLGPAGEYGRAIDATLAGLATAEEIGHRQWIGSALWTLGSIQLDLLDLTAARSTLERAHATAKETGSLHWTRVTAGFLARCELRLGEIVMAAAVLDANSPPDGATRTLGERVLCSARAELALATGDGRRALSLTDGLIATARAQGTVVPPRLAGLRGEALVLLDDKPGAETAYREAATAALQQNQRGLLWRMHAALAHLYRGMGQRSRSLEERQAAEDLIERLAETIPDAAQRDAFLDAAEQHLPPPVSQRQTAKQAFGGLTEREREIASLLTRGCSNAEIAAKLVISERTVETHITNILGKLRFTSRSQIAAWAVERGLATRI